MLDEDVMADAGAAVGARFDMRDTALAKEIEQLVALADRDPHAREEGRMSVKLRLICERDLRERAGLAWTSLRRAHADFDGVYRQGVQSALVLQLDEFLREGALRLAAALRERASDLVEAFLGGDAIDADWIARQRRRAVEWQAQSVEDYVRTLPKSRVGSLIKR